MFLIGPLIKPRSTTNVKPPTWYLIILAVSSVMWIIAFSVMFAMISDKDEYVVVDVRKRKLGGLAGLGTGVFDALENITIACGAFGVSAL